MTRPGWHDQNPRLESLHHAHVREQAEALERVCPKRRCSAAVGELCINEQTGEPYRLGVSHPERLKKEGSS